MMDKNMRMAALGITGAMLMLLMSTVSNPAVADDPWTATPGNWYNIYANGFDREGLSVTVTQNGVDHTFTPKAEDWDDVESMASCKKGSNDCTAIWTEYKAGDAYVALDRWDGDNTTLTDMENVADKNMGVLFLATEVSGGNITITIKGTKAGVATTDTRTVKAAAFGAPEMWLSDGYQTKGLSGNDCPDNVTCQSTYQGHFVQIYGLGFTGTVSVNIDSENASAPVLSTSVQAVGNVAFYCWSMPEEQALGNYTVTLKGTDVNGNATEFSRTFYLAKSHSRCEEGTKCYDPQPNGHTAATWPPLVMWVPAPIGMGLLLVAGLYVRLKRESLFNNLARSRIFEHIKANPGVHFRGLVDGLHLKMGTVTHHINVLEREGHVKSYQDGMYRRFYMAGQRPPLQVTLTNIQERILNIVQQNPGISQTDISTKAGSNRFVVNYHVRILQDVGMLLVERDGRNSKCFKMG